MMYDVRDSMCHDDDGVCVFIMCVCVCARVCVYVCAFASVI